MRNAMPDTAEARHDAVTTGVRSAKLEGFSVPGALQVINARFVRGEITAKDRLEQAWALCEEIARASRTRPRSA